ncbi:hypothetical protein JAAARDRAFT_39370 [Jaapia argillacea MUCL 33604]|uniref:G domain-containing protein n=1 Tax=Jaapia argillacea MUCL 33604 TaxID=933084 RepID=A0A067PES8_9AGAM|nr:hypothetical protein JAAARDRAFT_39370 [Jaapia argillacea MUCL 33604]
MQSRFPEPSIAHSHIDMSQPSDSSTSLAVQETPNDSPLRSTTSEIFEDCDRFRVLLVGRSGVGKSSLINAIFKIEVASVQEFKAGEATIDKEMTSEENPMFVLHDSKGYEPGEAGNLGMLEKFVLERKVKPNKRDRLHAIWLCIATPIAGGRILETGDEKIFKLDRGNVPIIVVFTKYDVLVTKFRQELYRKGDHAEIDRKCAELASNEFEKTCLRQVESMKRKGLVTAVQLSTAKGYDETLRTLVQHTQDHMESTTLGHHRTHSLFNFSKSLRRRPADGKPPSNNVVSLSDSVPIVFGAAQRVDPDRKISDSIKVGRKKYWMGLASSTQFLGRTLDKCLVVLHNDIVKIWNIRGLEVFLLDQQFMAEISKVVEELRDTDTAAPNPNDVVVAAVPKVGAAVSLANAAANPGAPIIVPIVAVVLLASWAYAVYRKTPGTVRCLMGYIVGLIIIMHKVFGLMQNKDALSNESVMQTVRDYNQSPEKRDIHLAIRTFVDDTSIWKYTQKDIVFDRIVSLIEEHCQRPSENSGKSLVESSSV